MANPTLAREDCAATNCTGLPYCISWHMQQFSSAFVQRFIGRQALGIADLMRVIAALGTHGKDRTSRPIYQTENGLHVYSLYNNTTANEGGTGSMAAEDSVLQRTPRRGNEQLNFFQPVGHNQHSIGRIQKFQIRHDHSQAGRTTVLGLRTVTEPTRIGAARSG